MDYFICIYINICVCIIVSVDMADILDYHWIKFVLFPSIIQKLYTVISQKLFDKWTAWQLVSQWELTIYTHDCSKIAHGAPVIFEWTYVIEKHLLAVTKVWLQLCVHTCKEEKGGEKIPEKKKKIPEKKIPEFFI